MAPSDDSADVGPDPETDASDLAVVAAAETAPSGTRFEVYRDDVDDWRWRLVHRNGNIIADGGEGYSRKAGALNGIKSVKQNAADAPVFRTEDDH
ncbi:DUF1508 domain-containing protein (plasmid) [Halarchaeum sp. CBA1220]|uniref:HVO_2922 family protein n=1 Tax=Halarchaeum sp. CBA1220 TaxID=1853682 RepID=UPI000F3A8A51|nr:HVO_2922 family protein [Halarchaeum sp. CBA1220]QLC35479.1 DUF1508 domain-containing protein [Halarchaeum sp. CBA1220]